MKLYIDNMHGADDRKKSFPGTFDYCNVKGAKTLKTEKAPRHVHKNP